MDLNRHAMKAIREIRGLSLTELAARCGASQPHLSNIEAGRRVPSGKLIKSISVALGVDELAITSQPIAVAA